MTEQIQAYTAAIEAAVVFRSGECGVAMATLTPYDQQFRLGDAQYGRHAAGCWLLRVVARWLVEQKIGSLAHMIPAPPVVLTRLFTWDELLPSPQEIAEMMFPEVSGGDS